MIRKLKRRYFISNMTLLSATLLIGLGILFGILYHSEVQASYHAMNTLFEEANFAEPSIRPTIEPTAFQANGNHGATPWWGTDTPEFVATSTSTTAKAESVVPPRWGDWKPSMPPPYWDVPPNPPYDWQNRDEGAEGPPPKNPDHGYEVPADSNDQRDPNQSTFESEPVISTEAIWSDSGMTQPTTPCTTFELIESKKTKTSEEKITTNESDYYVSTVSTTLSTTVSSVAAATKESTTQSFYDEGKYIPNAVIASFDAQGNLSAYSASIPEAPSEDSWHTVNQALHVIQEQGEHAGTLQVDDVPYRYLYQPDLTGNYRLVLLNRTLELSTISRLLFLFLLLVVIGLLVVFVISEMLANWTIKPIAAAWEKQKQFVADASHELKTPLAVISANTEVILSNPDASVMGQGKWLRYIQSETSRMSKLITELLSVARIDHNAITKPPALLRLSETVSNVCLQFEPMIYENGKTLKTVIQRGVILRADADNINQFLSILLDNAILHSVPNALITVTLSRDTQGKIRLAVSNTAKDIPQSQLVHLFDRFYRIDTEGSPNGSGLGLSIAQSIVRQMGGTLTVTSENQLVTFVATFSA